SPEKTNPPRSKDQKRRDPLEHQRSEGRRAKEPRRKMMHVPSDPGGKRLCLEVILQRRSIPPVGIAARELHGGRRDGEPEDKPSQEPQRKASRRRGGPGQGPPLPGCEEDREKSGLDEQAVPLEPEEVLPEDRDGEIESPKTREAR